ncbi:MAG: choice-of-anchor Q domain-containing protein [Anaerolineae bacterium]
MHTQSRSRALLRALLAILALAAVLAVGQPSVFASPPITCPSGPSVTLLVDAAVSGGSGDGSTWGNAYATLSGALATAQACPNVIQLWVAQGTYKPTAGADRSATFQLRNNLAIYGGFTSGQSSLGQRNANPATNNTVLSGDIGTPYNNGDNTYHVVTGSGTDSTAVLDGFTVTGGNASVNEGCPGNSCGGGMLNVGGSPTVTNVIFSANNASRAGGGMYNRLNGNTPSQPTVTNAIFSNNTADTGGGVENDYSNPSFINVVFSGNHANQGGAVYNSGNPPSDTPTTFTNATFNGNSASQGGAVYNVNSRVALGNSILWGDSAPNNGEIFTDKSSINSKTWVSYSIVQGSGGSGSGWWDTGAPNAPGTFDSGNNLDTDPLFVAPPSNLRLQYISPAINAGNNSYVSGVTTDLDGNPRIVPSPSGPVDMGAYESPCPAQGSLLYVNGAIGSSGNGQNWGTAYKTLAEALAGVPSNACIEIWVAQGTYTPTSDTDRGKSFALLNNVAIYGGFTSGQGSLGQRNANPATNNTVLSGDIGSPNDNSDNSYHVVTSSGTNYSAILDGFTVIGGNASDDYGPNDRGGGILMSSGSPTLTNLTVSGNSATFGGGGMYIAGGSPNLTNVTFSGNSAPAYDARGGGMVVSSGSPTLTNVVFSGNLAGTGGGMYNGSSNPILTNVTFSGNSSPGLENSYSNPQIRNSILWGDGDVEIWNVSSQPVVSYSIVQGGYSGIGNRDANPNFIAPITAWAPTTTGNLRLGPNSAAFNTGSNAFVPYGLTTDLDGNPRIVFSIVDMGAYERQDDTPPSVRIDPPKPANPTTSTSATFNFSGSDDMTPSDQLTYQCKLDNGAWESCTSPKSYSNLSDGSHTFRVTSTDNGANISQPATYTWLVDTTPPTVTLNPSANSCSLPGANGWCRGTQTAGFTASDAGSGVVSPPCSGATCNFTQSTTTNGSAVYIPSGQVCDAVGNCNAGINAGPFKIDSVAPTLSPTISPNPPTLGGTATATPNASDATSGVASQSCDPVNTSSVGAKTLTCTATDNAGNTTTVQVNYTVGYAVSTVSPTVGPPSVNSLYPTSIGTTATPVKWTLKNASGQAITAAGTVTGVSYKANPGCGTFPTDPTGATAASVTSANPKYDTLQKLWVYNWVLPGRGCYTLFITLNSGQVIPLFYHIY